MSDPIVALRTLGAIPVGDPAAMRDLARELRSKAQMLDFVSGCAHHISRHQITFEGPAGGRFRTRMDGLRRDGQRQVAELEQLAAELDGEATRVAAAQEAWRKRAGEIVQEAEDAARRAVSVADAGADLAASKANEASDWLRKHL